VTPAGSEALQSVTDVLEDAVARGDFPGAVALVRYHGETVLYESVGSAWVEPVCHPMRLDTVFDLASLTKPLATTPVVLRLVESGLLDFQAPAGRYLSALEGREELTLWRLLTHTSGLRGGYPTYATARTPEDVVRIIADLPPTYEAGTRVEYSCLGFIILGLVAERVTGLSLDRLADEMVFRPLGLRNTAFRPCHPAERYAATERGNDVERAAPGNPDPRLADWRTDYVPGAVHDGNAYYGMRGVSGNAGLFGTAADVGVMGQMWLNGGEYSGARVLSTDMVSLPTTNHTPGLDEARGLGWKINDPPAGQGPRSAGTLLSASAYGHTGFTGTCIWIDPPADLVLVLLTNGIHPRVPCDDRVIFARGRFHDAVMAALTSGAD
jgi:CubicO group peptidase (beta-lactamase class C family)